MSRRKDFYAIDGEIAKKIIKRNGFKMTELSRALGFSNSWLQHSLFNGSLNVDDVERLNELGVDLTPALKDIPENWIQKTDIGMIFDVILLHSQGHSITRIADEIGISWKTVRRYIETWRHTKFHVQKRQLEEMATLIEREGKECYTEDM